MALPAQRLAVLGPRSILCAAKGSQILTFTADGRFISSWSHPAVRENAAQGTETTKTDNNGDVEMQGDEPPAKKRKVAESGAEAAPAKGEETPEQGKGQRKQRAPAGKQEHQFIILLASTADGSHVVAVSGQDKALWVFEHDGSGKLTELSSRIMPKRPSSVDITADGKTIICADKFGDVYSLPLVEAAATADDATDASGTPVSQGKLKVTTKKGANELTVHSKRNLRALEEQRKHAGHRVEDKPKDGPGFEHDLLLGHVSMLTAVLATKVESRSYIITADRDEHIRISRGIPQSHVIEGFCLGHEAFINCINIPESRPDLLVSGGGDKELFVWKWLTGELVVKVDLLSHAQKISSGLTQIALSQLYSFNSSVLAICEKVPAVFVFNLQEDRLEHTQTIEVTGNPMDIVVVKNEGGAPAVVVAIDPRDVGESLVAFDHNGTTWRSEPRPILSGKDTTGLDDTTVSREDLERLLYTVENLRKTDMDEAGDGEDNAAAPVPTEPATASA